MTKVLLSLVILAGAASTACATANARTPPDRPTLEVPAPPAKVIDPPPQPEPAPPDPVPELPPATPTNSRPARPPTRDPARTDPKPEAPAAEAAPPPVTPVTPPPQLRTAGTPDASEAAKQVQVIIDRASKAIKSVNAQHFPKQRRAVYDNAVLLLAQAEDALKKSDFENAKKLAEKVETTAKELQGR
jgi:hypothetical protein